MWIWHIILLLGARGPHQPGLNLLLEQPHSVSFLQSVFQGSDTTGETWLPNYCCSSGSFCLSSTLCSSVCDNEGPGDSFWVVERASIRAAWCSWTLQLTAWCTWRCLCRPRHPAFWPVPRIYDRWISLFFLSPVLLYFIVLKRNGFFWKLSPGPDLTFFPLYHSDVLLCPSCNYERKSTSTFLNISLELSPPNTNENGIVEAEKRVDLSELLELHMMTETLDDDNKWQCSGCSERVHAMKYCEYAALPPSLMIHLKRFRYNTVGHTCADAISIPLFMPHWYAFHSPLIVIPP